VKDRT